MAERILVVEDEEIAREYVAEVLRDRGYVTRVAASGLQAVDILGRESFALVLSDIRMPDMDGMKLLEHVKKLCPDTEVIMVTGFASIEDAVAAVKKGAFHYLPKPLRLEEMLICVERALEKRRLSLELRDMKLAAVSGGQVMMGNSEAMRRLKEQILQAAGADCTVLILGETGTGKELVARALHSTGDRSGKPFVAVNCAAFSGELLANELFGHEKGAFTGAYNTRKGLLESASGGVFFLDEIGDMPLGMQAGLLRVLENRTLYRVGGNREIPVDVRIIAATNKDLAAMTESGAFRRDLYFRLNILSLRAPSLREHKEDIPLLAAHFIAEVCAQLGKEILTLDGAALDMLVRYEYPGNVRELRHALERAVILCNGGGITPDHLPPQMRGAGGAFTAFAGGGKAAGEDASGVSRDTDGEADRSGGTVGNDAYGRAAEDAMGGRAVRNDAGGGAAEGEAGGPAAASGFEDGSEVLSLEEVERRHLERVLELAGGSTARAARMLGLNRGSLWRKMKRLGLGG